MLLLKPGCEPNCPGCAHRTLSAEQSNAQKIQWLQRRLATWADKLEAMRSLSGQARWHYREKVRLNAEWQDNRWHFGLIRKDQLIPIPDCPVHSVRTNQVLAILAPALPAADQFALAFYIQAGAQATLVVKSKQVANLDWLDHATQQKLAASGLEGLWLHCHPAAGRRMFGKNGWRLLWGSEYSTDGNGLRYGPSAFQQLIADLYNDALDQAQTHLAPQAGQKVIDLYCGNGSTLVRWLQHTAAVIGVELSGEAVQYAQFNAAQATVLRGKCKDRIPQLNTWVQNNGNSLVYVNPPRTGIEPEVLHWLTDQLQAQRIAYLSCSAGTLCRDLEQLVSADYCVERIIPYDFFPHTYHVETLVLLSKTTAKKC